MEKCSWSCEHIKCTKLCHEICERLPCNEPCRKILRCKHQCIGLCGEPCPNLCRICDRDLVTEIFFGTEEDEDAKFVYLFDCKHIVEQTGMDQWIQSRYSNNLTQENASIKLPDCPKCKAPIRRNLRYSKYIKKQLIALENIKLKQFGEKTAIVDEKKKFLKKIKETLNETNLNLLHDEIKLKLKENVSLNELIYLKNKWNLFNKIVSYREAILKTLSTQNKQSNHIEFELDKLQGILNSKHNSPQIIDDIALELERVNCVIKFYEIYNLFIENKFDKANKEKILDCLNMLEINLIKQVRKFDQVEKEVQNVLKILADLTKLELTKDEKAMIHKAMGFTQGHW